MVHQVFEDFEHLELWRDSAPACNEVLPLSKSLMGSADATSGGTHHWLRHVPTGSEAKLCASPWLILWRINKPYQCQYSTGKICRKSKRSNSTCKTIKLRTFDTKGIYLILSNHSSRAAWDILVNGYYLLSWMNANCTHFDFANKTNSNDLTSHNQHWDNDINEQDIDGASNGWQRDWEFKKWKIKEVKNRFDFSLFDSGFLANSSTLRIFVHFLTCRYWAWEPRVGCS